MLITGKGNGQDITNVSNYSAVYYDKEMQVDIHSWHGLYLKLRMILRHILYFCRLVNLILDVVFSAMYVAT